MDSLMRRVPGGSDVPDPRGFLASTRIIDRDHPAVQAMARELADGCRDEHAIAGRCFLFVRDGIRHSSDFRENPVTLTASEVLRHRTGFCYAKSHLLAALLRANGIPAGLCYQRLAFAETGTPFGLHGLNAVFLSEYGWYRIDARGNKPGIDARFSPSVEYLAYDPCQPGEADLPGIYPEPFPEVVEVLSRCRDYRDVLAAPPDRKR